jgi:hypothetical protein
VQHIEAWDGTYPAPGDYHAASVLAREAADQRLAEMEQAATAREQANLAAQRAAARLRLTRELGYYLASLPEYPDDLNQLLYTHIQHKTPTAERLQRCLDRLGDYPIWVPEFEQELAAYANNLTEAKRQGRLIGKELEAALNDPRWAAGG